MPSSLAAGAQQGQRQLTSHEVQAVLSSHVLPQLQLCHLAALACSCKTLRELVYSGDQVWCRAAAAHLNPQHPSLAGKDRAAVQSAMLRRLRARHNISAGKIGERCERQLLLLTPFLVFAEPDSQLARGFSHASAAPEHFLFIACMTMLAL